MSVASHWRTRRPPVLRPRDEHSTRLSNAKFDPSYPVTVRRGRDASPRRPPARAPRVARAANAPYHTPCLVTTSTNVVDGVLPQQDAKMSIVAHGWCVLDRMQMAFVHLPHCAGSLLSVVSRVTLGCLTCHEQSVKFLHCCWRALRSRPSLSVRCTPPRLTMSIVMRLRPITVLRHILSSIFLV
jgi:hypothetical protein